MWNQINLFKAQKEQGRKAVEGLKVISVSTAASEKKQQLSEFFIFKWVYYNI